MVCQVSRAGFALKGIEVEGCQIAEEFLQLVQSAQLVHFESPEFAQLVHIP